MAAANRALQITAAGAYQRVAAGGVVDVGTGVETVAGMTITAAGNSTFSTTSGTLSISSVGTTSLASTTAGVFITGASTSTWSTTSGDLEITGFNNLRLGSGTNAQVLQIHGDNAGVGGVSVTTTRFSIFGNASGGRGLHVQDDTAGSLVATFQRNGVLVGMFGDAITLQASAASSWNVTGTLLLQTAGSALSIQSGANAIWGATGTLDISGTSITTLGGSGTAVTIATGASTTSILGTLSQGTAGGTFALNGAGNSSLTTSSGNLSFTSASAGSFVTAGNLTLLSGASGTLLLGTATPTVAVTIGRSSFTTQIAGPLKATGLIESTLTGFKFPDGTTQITAATSGGTPTLTSTQVAVGSGSNTISSTDELSFTTSNGLIVGNANSDTKVSVRALGSTLAFMQSASGVARFASSGNIPLVLSTNAVDRLNITGAGVYTFTATGSSFFNTSGTLDIVTAGGITISASAGPVNLRASTTLALGTTTNTTLISATGTNVGIGGTTGNDVRLLVSHATNGSTALRVLHSGDATSSILDLQRSGGNAVFTVMPTNLVIAPGSTSSGVTTGLTYTAPASTLQTTGTEVIDINIDLARTLQHAGNTAIAAQRSMIIQPPTYSSQTAGLVITRAATVAITGAPIAGINTAITLPYSLWVQSGIVQVDAQIRADAMLVTDLTFDSNFGTISFGGSTQTISADQTAWSIANSGVFIRETSTAARNVRGIAAGSNGQMLIICNVGTGAITFFHEDAGATAANRIILTTDSPTTFSLAHDGSIMFIYDGTSQRWRKIG